MAATAPDAVQNGTTDLDSNGRAVRRDVNIHLSHTPAAATAADATTSAVSGQTFYCTSVSGGYDVATGTGIMSLKSASTVLRTWVVTNLMPVYTEFDPPLKFVVSEAPHATLASGGGTSVGTVSMSGYFL